MTNLKQQLLQESFVTQLNGNQLDFYHNKYKTTIINPTNIPFKTLITLLKTIKKLNKNGLNIIIDNNQSIFLQNKLDNSSTQTTVDNLQETLVGYLQNAYQKGKLIMNNDLLTIANIFGWSADNIQLNEQLDYYKNLIKEDSKAIADNRLFLRNYSTASEIMSYFVDLMHQADHFLDTNTPFIIINTDKHIAHKDFKDMANYWNRVKNRINDDTAFHVAFESTRYHYKLFTLI